MRPIQDLPAGGIDIRAELAELVATRMQQALERTRGDMPAAAKLLRTTRLELLRLTARIEGGGEPTPRGRAKEAARRQVESVDVSRIAGGVELISAKVITRLAAEGVKPKDIGLRLGVNPYAVERALRLAFERRCRELDAAGKSVRDIARALRVPPARVARVLSPATASEASA